MSDPVVEKIQRHPKYQELRARRNPLSVVLTVLMLVVYYGYIGLIAFDKPFLAKPIGDGVTSLGIPIGMGVIVFTIVITVYYVRVANKKFDALTEELLKDVTK
ncbi:membrane protein [Alicycliphilus denitrificans]|jgi:uncharacterized membrane protein (DUF485 family)|uniref:DUF485 domain-containing protein n=1 Tax=Alicycliphilus denitrificans TaxID=179636 RepID=A0A3R7EWU9_9BURK|nr:DUF485 domain-containing protein [Alicycliphilus denitrificans]OJW84140.1 MAG: hypothetical protein BGO66_09545 [Alicycliphilus sp. 69-12]MBN9575021.1 DUF485 domain-containing protein [Alicycliphilus denitrificans]RKJ93982.1 DUF485 domain-containing protein [Alicycliphilus denitrificans]BCN40684.1 membrane protein [Alicycliphilus denitrificans]HRO82386.1 DUF485 domain-containing protein [Alicycliphilus denitrificans]